MESRAGAAPRRPRRVWPAVRVVLALALIAVLLWRIDLRQALALIGASKVWAVLAGVGCYLVLLLICNIRWQVLLRSRRQRFSGWFLFRVYLASAAMNAVLPTSLGGDALRVAWTAGPGNTAEMVSVVLVDRVLGLLGLLLLSGGASVLLSVNRGIGGYTALSAAALAAVLLCLAAVAWDPAYRVLSAPVRRIRAFGLGEKALRVAEGVRAFRRPAGAIVLAFVLSLAVWVAHCLIWYSLGLATGAGIPVTYYFIVAPIVAMATMIPVSVGGVGIRENGFVFLMARAGMGEARSGSIALLFLIITYLYALAGGVVLLGLKRRRPPEAA